MLRIFDIHDFSIQKIQNFKVIFEGNFWDPKKLPWNVPLKINYVVKKINSFCFLKNKLLVKKLPPKSL